MATNPDPRDLILVLGMLSSVAKAQGYLAFCLPVGIFTRPENEDSLFSLLDQLQDQLDWFRDLQEVRDEAIDIAIEPVPTPAPAPTHSLN